MSGDILSKDWKYREIMPSAFSDSTTWMNLGYWKLPFTESENTFEETNIALARKIGLLALMNDCSTILDLGCGRGDSLSLWISPEFNYQRVFGVNSNLREYEEASKRFAEDRRISLYYDDAVEFLERDFSNYSLTIVSIDALYHFSPSRKVFFEKARETEAKRLAVSDILLSSKWAMRDSLLARLIRGFALSVISFMGGVPFANLETPPESIGNMLTETGWKLNHLEIVTSNVFDPFASFCWIRARKFSLFSREKWTVLSSGLFMKFLGWSNILDFVIYSAEPDPRFSEKVNQQKLSSPMKKRPVE